MARHRIMRTIPSDAFRGFSAHPGQRVAGPKTRCPTPAPRQRWTLLKIEYVSMPFAGSLPNRCRSSFPDRSPQPQTAGNYTETSRAFTRKKLTILPAGLTRGTAYRDSLGKQRRPKGRFVQSRRTALAEQDEMHNYPASPDGPLNPRPQGRGTSGLSVAPRR